jgi:3-isopropylmalate dehydratase small subunit
LASAPEVIYHGEGKILYSVGLSAYQSQFYGEASTDITIPVRFLQNSEHTMFKKYYFRTKKSDFYALFKKSDF